MPSFDKKTISRRAAERNSRMVGLMHKDQKTKNGTRPFVLHLVSLQKTNTSVSLRSRAKRVREKTSVNVGRSVFDVSNRTFLKQRHLSFQIQCHTGFVFEIILDPLDLIGRKAGHAGGDRMALFVCSQVIDAAPFGQHRAKQCPGA